MKISIRTSVVALLLLGFTAGAQSPSEKADPPTVSKKSAKTTDRDATVAVVSDSSSPPDLATIQAELEGLSPEERRAKLSEYRKKYGAKKAPIIKPPQQVSAKEWKALTPEQRARHLQSWQTTRQTGHLTPEQRQEQLKIMQTNMEKQIRNLQLRQTVGTITEREADMLARILEQQKRLKTQQIRPPVFRGATTPLPSGSSR